MNILQGRPLCGNNFAGLLQSEGTSQRDCRAAG
jgi:hypothetical protein